MSPRTDDAILPATRVVSALVLPFLFAAFAILYFTPQSSGERFAWQVQPSLMAVYIASGYLGGAYLFVRALLGRQWHTVASAFPAVATFTVSMLLATLLHWNRFELGHFPFQVWLVLYIITPVLIPWLWLRNRRTDSGRFDPADVAVPAGVRWAVGGLGGALLAAAVVGFIAPAIVIQVWPWTLSPLAARLLSGWNALIGVGNLWVARDTRWSAWRVGIESIGLWHLVFLAGAGAHRQEFTSGSLVNWYTLGVGAMLVLMGLLYLWLETQRLNLKRTRVEPGREP